MPSITQFSWQRHSTPGHLPTKFYEEPSLVSAVVLYPNWNATGTNKMWSEVDGKSHPIDFTGRRFLFNPPTPRRHKVFQFNRGGDSYEYSIDIKRIGLESVAIVIPSLALYILTSGNLGIRIAESASRRTKKLMDRRRGNGSDEEMRF